MIDFGIGLVNLLVASPMEGGICCPAQPYIPAPILLKNWA